MTLRCIGILMPNRVGSWVFAPLSLLGLRERDWPIRLRWADWPLSHASGPNPFRLPNIYLFMHILLKYHVFLRL